MNDASLEIGMPNILDRPKATGKKANPCQATVLAHVLKGAPKAFLSKPNQDWILKHKDHQESIEKNDKREDKI